MLSLPDYRFADPDLERLSDWAELSCLLNPSGELTDGDLADMLHDSLLLDEDLQGVNTEWERAEIRASEIIANVGNRAACLGAAYPFQRIPKAIQRTSEWRDNVCFTTLLAADLGRFYRLTSPLAANPFTLLFEKIVEASMRTLFGGRSYRFGWPLERDCPKGIIARIGRLASVMQLDVDEPHKKTRGADKDLGLDVACRLRMGDEGPGTGIVLTQCATGENWSGKVGEPSTDRWAKLLYWNSHLIRAIAFPWRQDDPAKIRLLSNHYPGLIFDRLRLLCAQNPDQRLESNVKPLLVGWTTRRIAQIQNRKRRRRAHRSSSRARRSR